MDSIRILVVDDEALIRHGLLSLLSKEKFVKEIHEASNAIEFREQLAKHPIDLVLLDMKLPGTKGLELLKEVQRANSEIRVIGLTGMEGVELIINLLKSGIHGIVFKLDGYGEIVRTIQGVLKDGHYFQPKITNIIQANSHRWDHIPPVSLSRQENELLQAIGNGLTTKEIARQTRMTESTIETYRVRLIKKLEVTNTAALLAYAYRNGIL
ncbi:MAG: response regulator transcription factor [Cyclobacteriaceae bacterium]|nr:response regulator transcription factor [Cyclobacteriaceae bacterium]